MLRRSVPVFLLLGLVAASVVAGPPAPRGEAPPVPEQILTGTLTGADHEHYREVPFDVPEGVTRIDIRFAYDGKEQRSVIDLGLLDPERFRGWGGGSHPSFTLAAEDATPGFLPGPLPAGRWRLLLGVPNIRHNATAHFEARIAMEREGRITRFATVPLNPKPGWYRGDLHSHTGNSDGRCAAQSGVKVPCPVDRTAAAAAARGLDFIAITDHNTIAHFADMRALQPAYDRLLLVPGREITTFWGHANVFGPTGFIDFRTRSGSAAGAPWIAQARAAGGLISINHPSVPSGEDCMGCGWRIGGVTPETVEAIEVVNGGTMSQTGSADGPYQGFAFWQARLNVGERLTAIGGSDNHDAARPLGDVGAIGSPTTVVYMQELSVEGLLAGLRSGRVFIDVAGDNDRLLDMQAHVGSRQAAMGGTLPIAKGDVADVSVDVRGVPAGRMTVIVDGKEEHSLARSFTARDGIAPPLRMRWKSDGFRHWLRVDIRDVAGRLLLVGNPIYCAPAGT